MKMEKVKASQNEGESQRRTNRPGGITTIAVLNIIGGVIVALGSLVASVNEEPLIGLLGLGFGVFLIGVAIGLLKLKQWARIVAIIGYSINLLGGLVQLGSLPILGLFGIGIAVTVLVYLNTNKVKSTFTKSSSSEYQRSIIQTDPSLR